MRSILVLLALLFSAVLPASAAADANPVPQAPVLPVTPKTEVLPFTIQGGGDIEVAVLTGNQTPAEATWQVRNSLPLIDYAAQDIRVLARKVGVSDPADYFDASYKVRNSYPPGQGLGTEENPFVGVFGGDLRLRGWATGWENYEPGTDVADNWKVPTNAIGPVGGTGYDGNMSVVVLGNGGRITMTFNRPIKDGNGADFAVFENGFRISGSVADFIELGYVEVSSNGTDFVRFDSGTTHTVPIGAFAGYAADQIDGVAGRDLNGYGTPFDLTNLKNKQAVRDGLVDLNNITKVRIVDIQGTVIDDVPTDLDSFGRAIYDPWKTVGSGGFDLRGVGVLNSPGASIVQTSIKGTATTTAEVTTNVAGGSDGAQAVSLEFSESATDHSDAVVKDRATSAADGSNSPLTLTARDLVSGTDYWYRVVARSENGGETATEWKQFSKTPLAFVVSSQSPAKENGKVTVLLGGTVSSYTDGPQTAHVEVADNPEFENSIRSQDYTDSLIWAEFKGLEPNLNYHYRLVSEGEDGVRRISESKQISTTVAPRIASQQLIAGKGGKMVIAAVIRPGTTLQPVTTYAEFSTASGMTSPVASTIQNIDTESDLETVYYVIDDLPTVRHWARAVMVHSGGTETRTSTVNLTLPGTATTMTVPESTTLGQKATVITRVARGSYGPQKVYAELSSRSDHTDEPIRSEIQDMTASTSNVSFEFDGLKPGGQYWVRTTTEAVHVDNELKSEWVPFEVEELTDALGEVNPAVVGVSGATIEAQVDPGSFSRQVQVEYSEDGPGLNLKRTAVKEVEAVSGPQVSTFGLADLKSNRRHWYRVVSTAAGETEASAWQTFTTDAVPANIGEQSVLERGTDTARVRGIFWTGDLDQEARIDYRRIGDNEVSSTDPVTVTAAAGQKSHDFGLEGLSSNTRYEFRLVLTASDELQVSGEWASFRTGAVPASIVESRVVDLGIRTATVEADVESRDAAQRVVVVYREVGEESGLLTQARLVEGDKSATLKFPLTGLKAKTEHEYKVVAAANDGSEIESAWVTFTTAAPDPATVALKVDRTQIRAGDSVTLTWTTGSVESLTAENGWSGSKSVTGGSEAIRLDQAGTFTFRLVASGEGGDTLAEVTVEVGLSAKKLGLKLGKAKVRRGLKQKVTVTGLAAGEKVSVRYAGKRVSPAAATANAKGVYTLRFKVGKKVGRKQVKVTGSYGDRTAAKQFRITR